MRILQLIEATSNEAVPGSQTWLRNLYEPLIELGHEVVLFSIEPGRRAMQRKDASARATFSQTLHDLFRTEHSRKPFDLVFAYLMDGMVDPSVIDEIRKTGVPTCNFSCNNAHQFDLVDELAPHFDYNLHAEKDARAKFLAIQANPFWWPMASNPKYFKPYAVPRTLGVSFVGANYALRARYLARLLEEHIDVHAFGPGWSHRERVGWRERGRRVKLAGRALLAGTALAQARWSGMLAEYDFQRNLALRFPNNLHAPVTDDELIALYSKSCVSLGFLEVYDGHDPSRHVTRHLHLREFEAPMSGALYCTGYMEELTEHFVPEQEVVTYRDSEELLDKVSYFMTHEREAESIRRAGHARAQRDHTYHRRYQMLFEALGLA